MAALVKAFALQQPQLFKCGNNNDRILVIGRKFYSATTKNKGAVNANNARRVSTSTTENKGATLTTTFNNKTPTNSSSLQDEIHAIWEQASGDAELRMLKQQVSKASAEFDEAVRAVTKQRRDVEQKQKEHEEAYQKHASLLMRREQWTPQEASMFVEITSNEVQARQALQESRQTLHNLEEESNKLQQDYMDVLRKKYQEELAFQEQWRVLGTFGTWALIGLNSCVFLVSQVLFYRREARRLVDIENLIKQHSVVGTVAAVSGSDDASGESVTSDRVEDVEKEDTDDGHNQESNGYSETALTSAEYETAVESQSPTVDVSGDNPWQTKLKRIQHQVTNNLHVPSAVAGATVSAAACVIVGVLLSKR